MALIASVVNGIIYVPVAVPASTPQQTSEGTQTHVNNDAKGRQSVGLRKPDILNEIATYA